MRLLTKIAREKDAEEVETEAAEEVEKVEEFESFDVHFKIISNRNKEIYVEGYVTINDAEAEDTDLYYWNGSGYDSHRIIWHDGVEVTGATVEQKSEIEEFESDLLDNIGWTTEVILQSEEDENKIYVMGTLTILIGNTNYL